ncbi:hypothetical protein NE237_007142 [Protea cynaroides]|uniref:Uncharacterized protein n=1 Tax=Protea cynaroides TaxID=273540 RepID=A0A9Q0KNK7_9MAGN|nr:hypothetical protein NE237_007142 [Protea cynaroides]
MQMQQQQQLLQDAGYVFTSQMDHQQHQQQQQQQQFIPAGTHYIHHHATGPVPISSYYPLYPSAQQQQLQQQHPHQLDQQYPMYFLPVRQTQAYNLPVQSNLVDVPTVQSSRPPTPPNPVMVPPSAAAAAAAYKEPAAPVYPPRSAAPGKSELPANMYRTAAAAAPPLIHMPSDQHQHQILGYHQMHHPSQSNVVAAAGAANYAYEFADPTHAQYYYAQPSAATYQTMTAAAAVGMSEASSQLPTESSKQQQIRTTQAL